MGGHSSVFSDRPKGNWGLPLFLGAEPIHPLHTHRSPQLRTEHPAHSCAQGPCGEGDGLFSSLQSRALCLSREDHATDQAGQCEESVKEKVLLIRKPQRATLPPAAWGGSGPTSPLASAPAQLSPDLTPRHNTPPLRFRVKTEAECVVMASSFRFRSRRLCLLHEQRTRDM